HLLQQPEQVQTTSEFLTVYGDLRQALVADSQQWSERLIDRLAQSTDLSVPELRGLHLAQLIRLQRAVRVVGPALGAPFEPESLAQRLLSAERYDLWVALGERE